VTGVRPRQEVEREVMGVLHRELARLNYDERERALNWVRARLAADAALAAGLRKQASGDRGTESG